MNYIKLTQHHNGEPIVLNFDLIESFSRSSERNYTQVFWPQEDGDNHYRVNETPDEILDRLKGENKQ